VSKSVWLISMMGLLTLLVMSVGMAISLGQFQEVSAVEWVRLSESIARQFKAEHVGIKVNLRTLPSAMIVSYSSLVDSKYNLSLQNAEMESVANYAIKNFKGREQTMVDEIQVTRSETHGRGCFRQTYVAHFTLPNPLRRTIDRAAFPGMPYDPRKQ
jgi:hypothetical protein